MNEHEGPLAPGAGNEPGAPDTPHAPPPGAHLMNIVRWVLFVVLMAVAAVSIGSYAAWKLRPHDGTTVAAGEKGKIVYQCPMHPSIVRDKPGECPICGMTLEPVRLGEEHAGHAPEPGGVPGLADVQITPERIQMIGVRTARVERGPLAGDLELVGFVTPDEAHLKRVQPRVAGWIRELYVNQTGEQVRVGQPLLAIYSPELYQSEQEYLIERGAAGDAMAGMAAHDAGGSRSAVERLRLLGVPDEEIRRLQREGTASTRLVLRSPVAGTVLERGVLSGQYVGADTPLLTVADLSSVWVLADLYEMDLERVKVGDLAWFQPDVPGSRVGAGRIQFVYPTLSSETRTLKVRMALANPGGRFRPGMYGRVRVQSRGASTLTVPTEAVVNSGEHTYVFLARSGGRFQPRMVELGEQSGDRTQVLSGVAEGDTVVASASFLIDSESRLRAAIQGMGAQPTTGHVHGGTP